MPQKTSKQRRSLKHVVMKLTAKVKGIQEKISNGQIILPHHGKGAVWVLVDSGSNINVADRDKHFPGAALTHNKNPDVWCVLAANGTSFTPDGEFHMPFNTKSNHARTIDFSNANVAMPILHVKIWNSNGNRTTLDDTDGVFMHRASGEEDPSVARQGVYVANMIVKNELLTDPHDQPLGRHGRD